MKDRPLLYYRTEKAIVAYQRKSVKHKLQWLQAQMEFFHKAMPKKAKQARDRLLKGELDFPVTEK